ncbi:hypothetical protein [Pollutibacter soli]|uniref:hypothetical protein n=1 Tax=Pollutibacter soli TaxID=3034157 RepID=UPI0030135F6F
MYAILIIGCSLFLSPVCSEQMTKEQAFIATVKQVVDAFSRQDSSALVKFIDPKTGVFLLHRIGVTDTYSHYSTIGFSDSNYPNVLFRYSKSVQFSTIKYAKLPSWSCEGESWSKTGLFVDTTKTDHIVSKICGQQNKSVSETHSGKTINYFYDLENKSRRIVLVDSGKRELVFYLSYLSGEWFLTIVDISSSDCSV